MSIALVTFDIFGTVLDWRRGLGLDGEAFDRVIDRQGELESERFRPYAEIVAQSLVDELDMDPREAASIGAEAGRWPLFADSADAHRPQQQTEDARIDGLAQLERGSRVEDVKRDHQLLGARRESRRDGEGLHHDVTGVDGPFADDPVPAHDESPEQGVTRPDES